MSRILESDIDKPMAQIMRHMLKSKIHRAQVTKSDLNYEGSISIDSSLLEMADIIPHERVEIYNITNGERFSTYAIPAPPNSGEIQINGAAAHKAKPGDLIIIASYVIIMNQDIKNLRHKIVKVDEKNQAVPDNVGREM